MASAGVCRVCLVGNVGMLNVDDVHLLELYEKLTNTKLNPEPANGMPSSVCNSCHRLLQRCHRLTDMAHKSNRILQYLLHSGTEVTHNSVTSIPLEIIQTITGATTWYKSVNDYPFKRSPPVKEEQAEAIEEINQSYDLQVREIKVETLDENGAQLNATDQYPENYHLNSNLVSMNSTFSYDKNDDYNLMNIMDCQTPEMSTFNSVEMVFTEEDSLTKHPEMHTRDQPYACNRCNDIFNDNQQLLNHMQIHSDKTSQFFCKICEKNFFDKCNLTRHMRVHTGERPYACNRCDKAFTVKGHLIAHMRIHTGERPFACSQCEKTFTENCNLRRHMLRHTGEKPYSCNSCAKTFTEKITMTRHKQIHTGEKPHVCTKCNKTFSYKHNLRKHDARVHSKKNLPCTSLDNGQSLAVEGLEIDTKLLS